MDPMGNESATVITRWLVMVVEQRTGRADCITVSNSRCNTSMLEEQQGQL
jgi:hypothetical protein